MTAPVHTTPLEAFPPTRWSLVLRAGHSDITVQRAALAELLQQYLPALRFYLVAARRLPEDRADDLLQSFLVSKVLEDELIRRADRQRGRFRAFLLTALDHFLVDSYRRQQSHKRQTDRTVPLEDLAEPAVAPASDAFDLAWARQLLSATIARMQAECQTLGRPEIWGVFEQRILAAVTDPAAELPYDQLVARYGLKSPAQASNILMTAKRMFARVLRAVVAEYEWEEDRIDIEIADLREILSRSGR